MVEVLHESEGVAEARNRIQGEMSLSDIAAEMDQGDMVGVSRHLSTKSLSEAEAVTALDAVGSDASFFDLDPSAASVGNISGESRMASVMMQQGWSRDSLLDLTFRFLSETGLTDDFADFLEAQADFENASSDEEIEP